jgi:AcrR family transcriptional regulator
MSIIAPNNYRGRQMDPVRSQKIAEATWKLLGQHGYDALTFEAIAEQVGCSRATIYRRHRSKVDLVTTVLMETIAGCSPNIDDGMAPHEAMYELLMTGSSYLAGDRGLAVMNVMTVAHKFPELARLVDVLHNDLAPYYFAQFRRLAPGADEPSMRFAMYSLVGSVLYNMNLRRTDVSRSRIEGLVDATIWFFVDQQRRNSDSAIATEGARSDLIVPADAASSLL